jgi:hypothetical protein
VLWHKPSRRRWRIVAAYLWRSSAWPEIAAALE